MDRDADLLEIVAASHTASRFTRRLNSGQQQPNHDTNDREWEPNNLTVLSAPG